jgi:hypothetical protein
MQATPLPEQGASAGQVAQFSVPSFTPFPQRAGQSESLLLLHPEGQQPSPELHAVTGACVHTTSQLPAFPVLTSVVHALPSLQLAGQLPSQISPGSTTPFPHVAPQSLSVLALQPDGQQPSPGEQAVMGE